MITDLAERISDLLQSLRTASARMIVLRALLLLACLGAIVLVGPLAAVFRVVLVVLALLAVVVPDSPAPAALMIGVLALSLVTGHHPWPVTAGLTASFASIHLLATLASRGPLQADPRPGSLAAGAWAGWLGWSLGGIGLVVVVALTPDAVGRAPAWVTTASIVLVLAVLGVLAQARRG